MQRMQKVHAGFAIALQTIKVTATVCAKRFIKMEKALDVWISV